MQLPSALSFLVDEAAAVSSADRFLATLGARLVADGLPLAGGALTQAAPHPIIARRTWLWRAETGAVIEALGFAFARPADPSKVGRDWLAGLGARELHEGFAGAPASSGQEPPLLGWAAERPLAEAESALIGQVARF